MQLLSINHLTLYLDFKFLWAKRVASYLSPTLALFLHSPFRMRRWKKALLTLTKENLPSPEAGQGQQQWDRGGNSCIPGHGKLHTGENTDCLLQDEACSSTQNKKVGTQVRVRRGSWVDKIDRPQTLASKAPHPRPQPHWES